MADRPTKKFIREVAREAGAEAAHATLIAVGIDPDDPIHSQETAMAVRQLAEHAPELRCIAEAFKDDETKKDLVFARKARNVYNNTSARIATGAGVLVYAWLSGVFDNLLKKLGLH